VKFKLSAHRMQDAFAQLTQIGHGGEPQTEIQPQVIAFTAVPNDAYFEVAFTTHSSPTPDELLAGHDPVSDISVRISSRMVMLARVPSRAARSRR
jgi:hypothetical protein